MRKPSKIFEVGTKVSKISGKPFKSGFVVNTVKGVVEHPNKIDPETNVGVPAYTFFEDDSVVEAAACIKANIIFKTTGWVARDNFTKVFTQYPTQDSDGCYRSEPYAIVDGFLGYNPDKPIKVEITITPLE